MPEQQLVHPLHVLRRQHLILHITAPSTHPSQQHLLIPLLVTNNAAIPAGGCGGGDGSDPAIDADSDADGDTAADGAAPPPAQPAKIAMQAAAAPSSC